MHPSLDSPLRSTHRKQNNQIQLKKRILKTEELSVPTNKQTKQIKRKNTRRKKLHTCQLPNSCILREKYPEKAGVFGKI